MTNGVPNEKPSIIAVKLIHINSPITKAPNPEGELKYQISSPFGGWGANINLRPNDNG
jgi:hypothetical protein